MASYAELKSLIGHGPLAEKAEVAVVVKAWAILQEATPSADRKAWALAAAQSSAVEALYMLKYALAANAALTTVQILSAADAAIASVISTAVDKLHP